MLSKIGILSDVYDTIRIERKHNHIILTTQRIMVKLFLSLTCIVAAGLVTGTSLAVGYSHLHPSPLIRRDFFPFVNALSKKSAHVDGHHLLRRRIQGGVVGEVDDDCPGTPFLWKIVENATGEHVGFGVGTMHMPFDVVLTEPSWNSIRSAIEGGCGILFTSTILGPCRF